MSTVTSGGFSFSLDSVGGLWFWTVSINNIRGLGQQYQVTDLTTPYGKFTDFSIPIPGDVISAMSSSIDSVKQQLSPSIILLSGTPSTYSFTVTEGDSASTLTPIPFINNGAFGSFLTATATPDSPWIKVNPASVVGLGKNQQGQFSVGIIPATMLAVSSPYVGHVLLQDNNSSPGSVSIDMNVTVLPRPSIGVSAPTVNLSYSIQSGISSGAQQSIVSNSGPTGSILNFSSSKIQNSSPWLAFTPVSDGPLASGDTSVLTFSLIQVNIPLIPGVYTETVAVTSHNSLNSPQNIVIVLQVNE